jgi:polyhydroxyalkanoate synthase
MLAYPGRTSIQLYRRLALGNELATGRIVHPEGVIDLADVRVPVMNVAGSNDVLAPEAGVKHVETLLPNSPDVRIPTSPGGHLGILTGRSAASTTWRHIDEFFADHSPGMAA